MRIGTTPRHTFTLPFDPPQGSDYRVVYAQGPEYDEKIILDLGTDRCQIDGRNISVDLTQDETLRFSCAPCWHNGREPQPVSIQIGIATPGDTVMWSDIIKTTVERILKEDGRVRYG